MIIKQTGHEKGAGTIASREDYVNKLRDQLEKWNSEIDALKIDAQRARAETKVEFEKRIRQLHKKCEAARDKIEQIQASEDVPFEEIKAGAEQMWNGIKQLLIDTKAEFKKGVQEGRKP